MNRSVCVIQNLSGTSHMLMRDGSSAQGGGVWRAQKKTTFTTSKFATAASFLVAVSAMDAPVGVVRKPVVPCIKRDKCTNPACTFHHFSPGANFSFEGDPSTLTRRDCNFGAKCNKATCPFQHPSPCTWGDAPSRTSSADSMAESGPKRPQRPPRGLPGHVPATDMVESENSFHSSGQPAFLSPMQLQQQHMQQQPVLSQPQQFPTIQQQFPIMQPQQFPNMQPQQFPNIQPQQFPNIQPQQYPIMQPQQFPNMQPQFPTLQQQDAPHLFYQGQPDGVDDVDMGENSGVSSRDLTRASVTSRIGPRADHSSQNVSGNVDMQLDDTTPNRPRTKRGNLLRFDMRSSIGDMRDGISDTRGRVSNDLRTDMPDLRSHIGDDRVHDSMRNASNSDNMEDADMDEPVSTSSKKSSASNRALIQTSEGKPSRGVTSNTIFSKVVSPNVNSAMPSLPSSSALSKGAEKLAMPPPKPRNIFTVPKPGGNDKGMIMRPPNPPANLKNIFAPPRKSPIPPSVSDHSSPHGGSVTPKTLHSPPPMIRPSVNRSRVSSSLIVTNTVPGFKFGDEFLMHRSEIVDSRDFKQRFREKMHDGMCHRDEWDHREKQGNHNKFQPTFETAYSDHELRRETVLTQLYRSIKGITKTLDHIQTNFKGDDNALREQFKVSYYPTLRAAENDLWTYGGNQVYSEEWIVVVERMIKFCMYMYYLNTKPCEKQFSDTGMHSKSLEYAQKFVTLLMFAYHDMWAQHVMPPNCEEFCALSLATSALARIATNSNKAGGLAALCRVYYELPSHIRQRPPVQRTLEVLLCYFSDNITRFFELLDDKRCPYLVVLICSSEFYQIRFRFLKNFFAIKLDKVPFEALARFLFYQSPKAQASEKLVLMLSNLRCTLNTDDGEVDDLGSIFEIESDSTPPSMISFRSLSVTAIDAVFKNRDKNKEVSIKELSQTYHRSMGNDFEQMERTPFRPQVEKHPGKFRSFRDAVQDTKKSGFKSFSPQLQNFVFTDWPKLQGADSSTITFALKSDVRPIYETPLTSRNEPKPSESVGATTPGTNIKESDPRIPVPSISPAASSSVKVPVNREQPRPIFGKQKQSTPVIPLIPISPSPGPETPPQHNPFPPTTPHFAPLNQSPVIIPSFSNDNSAPKIDNVSQLDGAIEMEEERTQPSPKISDPFFLPLSKSQSEPAQNFPMPQQNSYKKDIFLDAPVQFVKAPASELEIDLNELLHEFEQGEKDAFLNSKLKITGSSWELKVTYSARREFGDWMTQDAAIGLFYSDLKRAFSAFSRPSQYGSAMLAMFGLGPGKRCVYFDWIGTDLAALGSNMHLGLSCPRRHELSAEILAIVCSWMVLDPYDAFQDVLPQHVQKQEKNHAFKALQSWAANKFAVAASKLDVGAGGTKTLISCFHASSPEDPATIAITLISPHKNWPFPADDRTIEDWKTKTCNRMKSIASKNASAQIKGSVVIYFPFLVDSVWKPSAPEMKMCYEELCGGASNVSFVCMSPWEVLEISEYLHLSVPESNMTREIVTELWAKCLPTLSPIRGVQESIYDQRDEAKFFSYGWPDITRSHVPKVRAMSLCASSVVRSVLIGCHYLINKEDGFDSCCHFDSVSVNLFDEITIFCQKLLDCFVASRAAPVKEVVLLMLEVSLEFFEDIIDVLEDPLLSSGQTRAFIRGADTLVDVDSIPSSSDDLCHAMNSLKTLIQSFSDGLKQLKNARKNEILDQCEAVAKSTIFIVNNLLKGPEFLAPLSPNRRWRDDELWKRAVACPHEISDRFSWRSHCQAISDFIATASFCGTDKNAEFPNGRLLDLSYHRSVAFQCIDTLLFFVCNSVLHGVHSTEHGVLLPRSLKLLRRRTSQSKCIQNMTADAIQKFQDELTLLKRVQPQKSPPPVTEVKPQVFVTNTASLSTPRRRRPLNSSGELKHSDVVGSCASTTSDQLRVAPGHRVLHDVQVVENCTLIACDVLDEDCRINRDFEHQMESFISGTLAFLESSCVKRVRDDIERDSSSHEKDRRINGEFEEQLQRALLALE